jgi:hypothetical protein
MTNRDGKWWLAFFAICCLTPAVFAYGAVGGDGPHYGGPRHGGQQYGGQRGGGQGGGGGQVGGGQAPQQVPEGGSAAIYLIGAGLTCFGAMFLRSRAANPAQS